MIYKLNDATYRPLFGRMIEWIGSASGLARDDSAGRILRQIGVYGFLDTFFGNLKSIVTGYAAYVVENAVAILYPPPMKKQRQATLAATALRDPNTTARELWRRVLRTLVRCFENDQDGFWQAPAHFGAVALALVAQFDRVFSAISNS